MLPIQFAASVSGGSIAFCKGRPASRLLLVSVLFCMPALLFVGGAAAQTSVVTQHNDNFRSGANTNESILIPASVNTSTFGKLFSFPVDGQVYAQSLYLPGVTMGPGTPQAGTTHNVLFVVTEHDSVYAFDADNNGGANANPLWHVTMLDAAHGAAANATTVPATDTSSGDIKPEFGITSTPVIDTTTNTIYVVSKSKENGTYVQRLHALDLTTGLEKFGGPMALQASVPGNGAGSSGGTLSFDSKWELNRPGLLLLNGIVYIAFGSHGDNGPWHGWVLAYNASNLQRTSAYCTSPNGSGSGIWMSGAGLAADVPDPVGHPYGRMFIPTGNGSFNATIPYTNSMNYGDDHIRLDLTGGVMTVTDSFTPFNEATLNNGDIDVASGGILLLPDQSTGGHQHLLVQIGKEGKIYLVDRDNMGGFDSTTDQIIQELPKQMSGVWSMPAYWNGTVYFGDSSGGLTSYPFVNGLLSTTGIKSTALGSTFPGIVPTISSNGNTNGIVWSIETHAYNVPGPAVLYANDATNVRTLLYSSKQNPGRDTPGLAIKFAVPTIVNGKVYVGTASEVSVYGLLNGVQQAASPIFNPGTEAFLGTISVAITDSTPGAAIYYTTDGSIPTTASTRYVNPIPVSTTETINAIASATGFLQSAVVSNTYTLQTQTTMPFFTPTPGVYTSAQNVTISDTSGLATIYYTLDGTSPTPSSTKYIGPVAIGTASTLKAIAVAPGLSPSPVASGLYTIIIAGSGIDFSSGFASAPLTMTFNGTTQLADSRLQLTNGLTFQAGSAFFNTPVNIQAFTNDFTFQLANPNGEGITFTIQGSAPTALGAPGGGLGYGRNTRTLDPGIQKSVAIKFDLFNTNGEGPNSTGIYTNGTSPWTPAKDLTASGIDLHSGDTMAVHMTYDGTTLTMTITDGVTLKVYSTSWPVNIPSVTGGNTAYVGFTGSTSSNTSSQKIESWTFVSSSSTPTTATPAFTPGTGTYTLPQSVSITDGTSGASIYYTTNGTTPTTSSTLYTAAIPLSATTTIQAIAASTGNANSSIASATYTIQAATPILSPVQGSYATPQDISITDTTPNSTIYYTVDGSVPTTSSLVYGVAIHVSTTTTVKTIAAAPGLAPSAVASALYTIGTPQTAMPTFLPVGGTYSTTQQVTISDATGGATIFYTLDGTTPATSVGGSTFQFTTPINVSATTTIKAIATASGFSTSNVGTAAYVIATGGTVLNYGTGFTAAGLQLNGKATINAARLRLTDGGAAEAASAFSTSLVNVQSFTTDFTFQQTNSTTTPSADGITFVIQGNSPLALGSFGGGLGYGLSTSAGNPGIQQSVAVKFDLFSGAGEGPDSTGLYTNGAVPTVPARDMTSSGVDLHSQHVMKAHLSYDGTTLTMTLTDTITNATFSTSWPVNIPAIVGGRGAYVGFTGGTGGNTAIQEIVTWTYTTSGVVNQPVVYATKSLPATSSGPTFRTFPYTLFPDGTGTILDATKVGDNVTLTLNVAQVGTYDVKVSGKRLNTRGIFQLAINGTNFGASVDEYGSTDSYAVYDLGTFSFAAAGNYSFKFSVTGKNASSTGYSIAFDDIMLTQQ